MRAFEVFINGKRTCLAGVGDAGRVNGALGLGVEDRPADRLEVGALDNDTRQHSDWGTFSLNVGDEVRIVVRDVERSAVDPPVSVGEPE